MQERFEDGRAFKLVASLFVLAVLAPVLVVAFFPLGLVLGPAALGAALPLALALGGGQG